jgi:DNA-binding GntR family transcriptional regulator
MRLENMQKGNGARRSADEICHALREQISSGRLPANSRVTEQALAEEFGTSRTPVREAMRLLVAEGFLSFKPNSGSFVRSWSQDEIEEIFAIRFVVESEIAALAASRVSSAELTEMRRLQASMEALGTALDKRDVSEISRLNRAFHLSISNASRSPRLVNMLESAVKVPIVQSTFSRYAPWQLMRSHHHHRELLDAFAEGDAVWARAVMQCHISSAREVMRRTREHGGKAELESD